MNPPADPTAPSPDGLPTLVGQVVGERYRIVRRLGDGGMGTVYEAEHTLMHKRVALKVLHAEMSRMPEVVARFEREAMAAGHIDHPNVAAATDFGKMQDGAFYLVLEFVEGASLRDALGKGRFQPSRALHIARQMASALGRAHGLGIVHRDLKPENVMLVSKDGDPDFVKVLDFGIAKVPVGALAGPSSGSGPVLTQLGMVYGTPEYMAPEQAMGQEVDARADLYALGVILFEMLTGRRPFDNDNKVVLLGMHVTAPVPRMSDLAPDADVPPGLEAVVSRLLAKDAAERFASARELTEALDAPPADHAAPTVAGGPAAAIRVQARAQALAAGLGDRLRQTASSSMQRLAAWAAPRRRSVAISVVAVLLLAGGVAAAVRRGTAAAGAVHPSGWSPLPAIRLPDPRTEQAVADARAKIEKGDLLPAIDVLLPVEKDSPRRADVHMLLERAYWGTHQGHEAMREAGEWLALEPAAATDARLEDDVRTAAVGRDVPDEAFGLLEGKMGAHGLDLLYDLAYGTSNRAYPQAAARAKRLLAQDDVRSHASDALAVLLDFRDAKTCDAKRDLLDRARDKGDARMSALLQQHQSKSGCGFLGMFDCYGCLHKDTALRDTISAIEDRVAKAP
jgi:serine/threonine-protein kinase